MNYLNIKCFKNDNLMDFQAFILKLKNVDNVIDIKLHFRKDFDLVLSEDLTEVITFCGRNQTVLSCALIYRSVNIIAWLVRQCEQADDLKKIFRDVCPLHLLVDAARYKLASQKAYVTFYQRIQSLELIKQALRTKNINTHNLEPMEYAALYQQYHLARWCIKECILVQSLHRNNASILRELSKILATGLKM